MVEFFELVSSYWNKSKKDWEHNKYRLYTLFAFVLIAYLILELGSFVFTKSLNHARTVDEIRTKFIDKRVAIGEDILKNFFTLKESARILIKNASTKNFSARDCEKLQKDINMPKIESDLFISVANFRYFYGDEIADELLAFTKWYDIHNNDCFISVANAEDVMDEKVFSIRKKMWRKMYPPDIIKEIQ